MLFVSIQDTFTNFICLKEALCFFRYKFKQALGFFGFNMKFCSHGLHVGRLRIQSLKKFV